MMPPSQAKQAAGDSSGPVSYELQLRAEDATECYVCGIRMQRVNCYSAVRPLDVRTPMSMLICDNCTDNLLKKHGFGQGGIN